MGARAEYEVAFAQGVYRVEEEAKFERYAPLRVVRGDYNTACTASISACSSATSRAA